MHGGAPAPHCSLSFRPACSTPTSSPFKKTNRNEFLKFWNIYSELDGNEEHVHLEKNRRTCLQIPLPPPGRDWEDFPPCSDSLVVGGPGFGSSCLGSSSALPLPSCGAHLCLCRTHLPRSPPHSVPPRLDGVTRAKLRNGTGSSQGSVPAVTIFSGHFFPWRSQHDYSQVFHVLPLKGVRGWLPLTVPLLVPATGLSALHSPFYLTCTVCLP